MSHAVIAVGVLVPGGLVLGGLIVGGLIIGRAITHAVEKNKQLNEKIAQETFEANNEELKNEFIKSIQMVLSEINELDFENKEQLSTEISQLKSLPESLLKNYNIEVYKSIDHEKFINFTINEFNSKMLEIKQKVEEVKLGTYESKKIIETKVNQIEEQLYGSLDVPVEYIEDYKDLKEQFDTIKDIASIKDKVNFVKYFEIKFRHFAENCNLNNVMNINGLKEEKIQLSESESAQKLIQKEIINFHEKIKFLDEEVYIELEPIVEESIETNYQQRLDLIRDQVKLKYGKLKEHIAQTNVYKHNLSKLANILPAFRGSEEILKQINLLFSNNKYISKDNFDEIYRRINDFIAHSQKDEFMKLQKNDLIGKVKSSLENLGYSIIDDNNDTTSIISKLQNGEIVYIDTEWTDYKVMLKIDKDNQIATRLTKFVATDEEKTNVSTYQKQKDAEVSKKWCKHYDRFLEEMKSLGVEMEVKLRKEAEEEDLLYMVNKDLVKKKVQEATKIIKNDEMRL